MQKTLLAIMLVCLPIVYIIGGYAFIVAVALLGKFALFYEHLKITCAREHSDVAALKYIGTDQERRYA